MRTPALACEVTLQPINRYPGLLDAAIIFSDILVIPQALGLRVEMVEGKGPVFLDPLTSPSDFKRLVVPVDIKKELGYMMDAITLTRMSLQGRVPLIGFAGAPWTLFSYMVAEKEARLWLYQYPEECHALLDLLANIVSEFLVAQVDAGAQLLQVFDSAAGELPPGMFREFSLPYLRKISQNVRHGLDKMGLDQVPLIVFARGAHFAVCDLADSGYDVVSLDWTMDAAETRTQLHNYFSQVYPDTYYCGNNGDSSQSSCYSSHCQELPITLQGNLDPASLHAPFPVLEKKIRDMIDEFGETNRYIVNLGHGMWPSHDPDKVKFFLKTVKKISCRNCLPEDL